MDRFAITGKIREEGVGLGWHPHEIEKETMQPCCDDGAHRETAHDPDLIRSLSDLAPSRPFAAFERHDALRATPRSLFDLCPRASVPFAVVNSVLQANLPSHLCSAGLFRCRPPAKHGAMRVRPLGALTGANKTKRDYAGDDGGDGDDVDRYQARPPRWVSCCGCASRSPNGGAPNQTAAGDCCSARPPCPHGWLRRIGQREALRIAA